jgi:predicted DNA-binding protein (MmcQ/YjbR family)
MNIEDFRSYCLSKPFVNESFPFDETTLVFKVAGKMFAITDLNEPFAITLKCDPDRALFLREHYPAIRPAWHFNKQHWNRVEVDGSLTDELLIQLIDHSFNLVVQSLPKKRRIQF